MTLHAEQGVIGIKKVYPEHWALTGSTVAASTITSITDNTKTADEFNNGYMCILDGIQKGNVYRVIDNGVDSITVDRPSLVSNGTITPSTDRVAMFPAKRLAEESVEWLMVDSFDGLVPEVEYDDLFSATRDGEPYRTTTYIKLKKIEGNIEFTPQNANMMPVLFGKCVDAPSSYGNGTLLNGTIYAGEQYIVVDGVGTAAVNSYIAIGATTDQEIRKVTAENGTTKTWTLDKPLRRTHADNASVRPCSGTYYTHTYSQFYDNIYRQWPFEVVWEQSTDTGVGCLTHHAIVQCNGVNIRNDGDKLKFSLDLIGVYYTYTEDTAATAPTAINGSVLRFSYSSVYINGVEDGKVTSVDVNYNYGGEAKYYHTTANDYFPTEVTFSRTDQSVRLGVRVEDPKFLALATAGTEFDAYAKYYWNGTEYMQIKFDNCRALDSKAPLPAGGPIEVDWAISPQYIQVVVVDTIPYH